ncbi:MAG: hypothetical protein JWO62_2560 [Acidimicrobiaceae bacterium]|nr:hypothetical protein [Acidimicrobiaceae bacterium]
MAPRKAAQQPAKAAKTKQPAPKVVAPARKTSAPTNAVPRKRAAPAKKASVRRQPKPAAVPSPTPEEVEALGFGRNRQAAEATIAALRSAGRLEPVDSARIAAFQVLADQVDKYPTADSLWREYRMAEGRLREVQNGDDGLAELLRSMSTPVGDAEDVHQEDPRT